METQYKIFKDKLLPILRCTNCHCNNLIIEKGNCGIEIAIPLYNKYLICTSCNSFFPITEDIIPIMWTSSLRKYFTINTESNSNIGANIEIYDTFSNNYQSFTRQNQLIGLRISNAVKQIINFDTSATKYHLDFGCGPGHVLNWLKHFNFFQIGLDVSINNLRNTRKNTGALVVCGDATNMPFVDNIFDLVTESSVLHHIKDWKSTVSEACRICKRKGGIIIDSEPSKDQMAWSSLAKAVYNARFPFYKLLSYVKRDKYIFRDIKKAKLNLIAEIHHQPGAGFPIEELKSIFESSGFKVNIVLSPDPYLKSKCNPSWKSIILSLLSARNPFNPKYGAFTAIAKS